ncbi:MAG TPA: hypothetical protein PKH23_05930 [Bacillota bacterium]|nr:hypothetical protein [Bacillota bacterium]
MIFRSKYERAVKYQKEKMKDIEKASENTDIENVIEKGDKRAMIIAALVTILPICAVLIILMALVGYFFIARPW